MDQTDGLRGFIKLHRSLYANELWRERRKFSRAEAWIDLLMMAQWRSDPRQLILGGRVVVCCHGQVLRTQRELGRRWGWTGSAVSRYLTMLAGPELAMIRVEDEHQATRITILNYPAYQGDPPEVERLETRAKERRKLEREVQHGWNTLSDGAQGDAAQPGTQSATRMERGWNEDGTRMERGAGRKGRRGAKKGVAGQGVAADGKTEWGPCKKGKKREEGKEGGSAAKSGGDASGEEGARERPEARPVGVTREGSEGQSAAMMQLLDEVRRTLCGGGLWSSARAREAWDLIESFPAEAKEGLRLCLERRKPFWHYWRAVVQLRHLERKVKGLGEAEAAEARKRWQDVIDKCEKEEAGR